MSSWVWSDCQLEFPMRLDIAGDPSAEVIEDVVPDFPWWYFTVEC